MSGFWLICFIVLWIIVILQGIIILTLAREIEYIRKWLESLRKFVNNPPADLNNGQTVQEDLQYTITEQK